MQELNAETCFHAGMQAAIRGRLTVRWAGRSTMRKARAPCGDPGLRHPAPVVGAH